MNQLSNTFLVFPNEVSRTSGDDAINYILQKECLKIVHRITLKDQVTEIYIILIYKHSLQGLFYLYYERMLQHLIHIIIYIYISNFPINISCKKLRDTRKFMEYNITCAFIFFVSSAPDNAASDERTKQSTGSSPAVNL